MSNFVIYLYFCSENFVIVTKFNPLYGNKSYILVGQYFQNWSDTLSLT